MAAPIFGAAFSINRSIVVIPTSLSRSIFAHGPAPSAAEVDSLLELAIDRTLAATSGQIGMFLSGGVDSSLLLRFVLEREPIAVFTVAGSEQHPDLLAARRLASEWQVDHHWWVPSRADREKARSRVILRSDYYPGDEAVYLACQFAAEHGIDTLLATDGIDEITGGYWWHAHPSDRFASQIDAFVYFWNRLWSDHLEPLCLSAADCGLSVLFPYLDEGFVARMTCIPLPDRASPGRPKAWWRNYAGRCVPEWVVERPKIGFIDALRGGLCVAERA